MSASLTDRVQVSPEDSHGAMGRSRKPDLGNLALIVTALIYGVSQVQVWRVNLAWDETIYFSQVSKAAPAAFFSAPRARGITWLAVPLAHFTSSPSDLRVYLSVLSGLAFYLAFRVWLKVLPSTAVVVAALFFGSLWITRYYGAELMPNLWVALGGVAAVGGFLRLVADRSDRLGLFALPIGLAVAAVMRPSDAAWIAVALLLMTVLTPAWRWQGRVYLLIIVGSVAGAAPWVVEAYQRWGGVQQRLDRASAIQGGLGWHAAELFQHWQTLDGPLLCRPCTPPATPAVDTAWFLVLPVAVIFAGFACWRLGRVSAALVPAGAGLTIAIPYLLLVGYSAPRFLLPAFALLSLPAGVFLRWLALTGRKLGWFRPGPVVLVLAVLIAQVTSQQLILNKRVSNGIDSVQQYSTIVADLRQAGVHAPCVVSGYESPPIAYYAGCSSRNIGGHDGSITVPELVALAQHESVVLLRPSINRPPRYARFWTPQPISIPLSGINWVAFVSRPTLIGTAEHRTREKN